MWPYSTRFDLVCESTGGGGGGAGWRGWWHSQPARLSRLPTTNPARCDNADGADGSEDDNGNGDDCWLCVIALTPQLSWVSTLDWAVGLLCRVSTIWHNSSSIFTYSIVRPQACLPTFLPIIWFGHSSCHICYMNIFGHLFEIFTNITLWMGTVINGGNTQSQFLLFLTLHSGCSRKTFVERHFIFRVTCNRNPKSKKPFERDNTHPPCL